MAEPPRIQVAVEGIRLWMLEHGAPLLAQNLAAGASEDTLAALEKALGFPVPADLKDLWRLHNGQKDEGNGFVEFRDLLDTGRALGEKETADLALEFLREHREDWTEASVTEEEVTSDRWIPVAGRDSDLIVVSGVSGRVFTCEKDSPPLRLLAPSVAEWLEGYAARVAAGDYAVEEGFGDYYLALRDRVREARDAEAATRRREKERYRAETPLLQQVKDALQQNDGETCREVLERVVKEGTPDGLAQAMEVLFAGGRKREVIAVSLQYVLDDVTLSPAQWATVAAGAKSLGNNAIADTAARRAGSAPAASPASAPASAKKPWWKFW